MKQKVLVLGSTGLIGHQVFNYLKKLNKYKLYNIAYRKKLQEDTILVDARDEALLINTISSIKPDILVNCMGILISGANEDPENAIFLNAYMPHRLKRLANSFGGKLIHISTDCVFSGRKKDPYLESDEKDGLDIYAKAKGLGEIYDNHLTLRTSVIGPELKTDGEELFHWFMQQKNEVHGFSKSIWSGVTTLELAKAVHWAIQEEIIGLYHVTNNQKLSKYELLQLINCEMKKNIHIHKVDGKDLDKSFIDTRKEMNYSIPSYDVMVKELATFIYKNDKLYQQYVNQGNENR